MNDFNHSCNAASTYPKNLISPGEYQHNLQSYVHQLDQRQDELFDIDAKAALHFWDLEDGVAGTELRILVHLRPGDEDDVPSPSN